MPPLIRAPARRSEPKPWQLSLTAGFVAAIASLDLTLFGTAIAILGATGSSDEFMRLAWILIVSAIPTAYLILPAMARANRTGRKRVASRGMVIFTVGALIAAIAPVLGVVILGRLLQSAIALGLAGTLAVLATRARTPGLGALSQWAIASVIGLLAGPLLAGALLQFASWRSLFVAEAALGVIAYLMIRTLLVEGRADDPPPRSDMLGAALLGLGLLLTAWAFLAFTSSESSSELPGAMGSWTLADSPAGWIFLVAGTVVIVAGILRLRSNRPTRSRVAVPRLHQLSAVALGVGVAAALVTNAIYLAGVDGLDPWGTAVGLLPFLIAVALTSLVIQATLRPSWARPVAMAGAVLWTVGLIYSISVAPDLQDTWTLWTVLLVTQGAGIGVVVAVTGDPPRLLASVPRTQDAAMVVVAAVHAARQFGAALGIVALTLLFLGGQIRDINILERGWVIAGAAGLLAAIIWLVITRHDAPPESADTPPPGTPIEGTASTPDRGQIRRRPTAALLDFLRQRDLDPLAELPMFAGLSSDQRERMAEDSAEVYVTAGDAIYECGDRADALYVVRSGRVDLEVDGQCVRRLGRGDVFGEGEVLDGHARSVTAVARRDASLMRMDRSTILAIDDVAFFRSLAISLSERLADLTPRAVTAESASAEATVSVLAVDPEAPAQAVGKALEGLLTPHLAVITPGRVDRLGLERAESLGDLVLLIDDPRDPDWSNFCRRVADRTISVTTRAAPSAGIPVGSHVVIVDQDPTPDQLSEWFAQVTPASRTLVRHDHLREDLEPLRDRLLHRSLGIAFGGGGARGLAHIGVMDVLTAAGIRVDRIAGTSMGALVGACFAAGLDPDSVDALCFDIMVRGNPMSDYTVPRKSLLRGRRLDEAVQSTFGDIPIEALKVPFACVSVDLVGRREIVHRSGSLAEAVAASSRLPGILPPVRDKQGGLLVDGSLLNNLPVNALDPREGPIVAVQVGEDGALNAESKLDELSLADTIMRSLLMASDNANAEAISRADLHIRPDTSSAGLTEFHRLDAMREAGQRAAEEALPALEELLKFR